MAEAIVRLGEVSGDQYRSPVWLMREVLEPVLADLQRPHPIDLVVELDHRAGEDIVLFSEQGQPGS